MNSPQTIGGAAAVTAPAGANIKHKPTREAITRLADPQCIGPERIKVLEQLVKSDHINHLARADYHQELTELRAGAAGRTDDPGIFERAEDLDSDEAQALAEDIQHAMLELGDDGAQVKVMIYRYNQTTRLEAFLTEWAPAEFSMRRVAQEFGGGIFHAKVYGPQQKNPNKIQLYARKRFVIEGAAREPVQVPAVLPAAAAPAIDAATIMERMVSAMQAGFSTLASQIQNARPPSLRDQLEEFKALRDVLAPAAPAIDGIAMYEKLLQLQRDSGPGPENPSDGSILLELVKQFGPTIRDGLARLNVTVAPPRGAPAIERDISETPGAPAAAVPAAPADESTEEDPLNLIYTGYMKLLVNNAQHNNDVEPLAEQAYNAMPDEFMDWILGKDDYLEELAKYDQRALLHRVWFDRLRDAIKKMRAEDPGAAGAT